MRYKYISFCFSNLLFSISTPCTKNLRTFSSQLKPTLSDTQLTWANDKFNFSGQWKTNTNPIKIRLIEYSPNEYVDWELLQAPALSYINFKKQKLEGSGYTERMVMTIKPWQLGIDELRWGRFVSDEYAVTWIIWRGTNIKNILIVNGKEYVCSFANNEEIRCDELNLILRLDNFKTIRSGGLSSTVLKHVPSLRLILPKTILNLHELKWQAHGELAFNGQIITGNVIHELVSWNKQ